MERGEGFGDAADGELVGLDVEVVDGVVDELRASRSVSFGVIVFVSGQTTYSGWILGEKHCGGCLIALEAISLYMLLVIWLRMVAEG